MFLNSQNETRKSIFSQRETKTSLFSQNETYKFSFFTLQEKRVENFIEEIKILKEKFIQEKEEKDREFNSKIEQIDKVLSEPVDVNKISSVIKSFKDRRHEDSKYKQLKFVPKGSITNNPMDLIKTIYQKIKSGGKLLTFYGMKNDFEEAKFGKISYWGNTLYFHSLDLYDPEDCTEFLKFRDLNTMLSSPEVNPKKDFRLFLKICSSKNIEYIINIRILESIKTPHVVSLFTGECGSSYKGSVSKSGRFAIQSQIYGFETPSESIGNCWGLYDYEIKAESRKDNSFFLIFNNEYEFFFSNEIEGRMVKVVGSSSSSNVTARKRAVGIAEISSDLKKLIEHEAKVVECGFSLTII